MQGLVQVPGTVGLGSPVARQQLVSDVGQGGVLDHGGGVQHAAQREPGGGCGRHQPVRRAGMGNVAAFRHDIRPDRPEQLDCLQYSLIRRRSRAEHDPAAARHGHLLGQEQP